MENKPYQVLMSVRDYECDIQGIVNNAVYQNYLEHARHEYLKNVGVNFTELAKQGINLVVVRIELDYKQPLMSGDNFYVTVQMERESRVKFAFRQNIHRQHDDKLMLTGKVIGTSLAENGRPNVPDVLENVFS
ncbi:MAG: acyl-CoA thioesterase [Gammaproteobacteria bacterium]|jgi:acyl-CoA thioester hydrolase